MNDWKWPSIPGLHTFKGKLLHSAKWDEAYDYSVGLPSSEEMTLLTLRKNKRMAVIGSGSSAIQIVPGIQPSVNHIDHYVRGKTWIATTFAVNKVKERGEGLDNCMLCADPPPDGKPY